jgi:hypothetical protein
MAIELGKDACFLTREYYGEQGEMLFAMSIPKWAKWKTTDANGSVFIWQDRPCFENGRWYSRTGIVYGRIMVIAPITNPENTLVKIQW